MLLYFTSLLFSLHTLVLILFLLLSLKIYVTITLGVCTSKKRLDGKIVIVTGGATGIGRETALELAKRGAKVILACLDLDIGIKAKDAIIQESGNDQVFAKHVDLSSLKSVRKFASEIKNTETKLDILVNNAGCARFNKSLTAEGLEYQMASNYFGHFLLTNLLLGLLQKSKQGRVINVASEVHKFCHNLNLANLNFTAEHTGNGILEIYCASKMALLLFTRELAKKLSYCPGNTVSVNSLHPGAVRGTDFINFLPRFTHHGTKMFGGIFMKTAKEGAQTSIYLAVADEVANVTGKYFKDCRIANTSKLANDKDLAKKLWDISERLVGLKHE